MRLLPLLPLTFSLPDDDDDFDDCKVDVIDVVVIDVLLSLLIGDAENPTTAMLTCCPNNDDNDGDNARTATMANSEIMIV